MKDLSHFINENSLDFIATTLQMMPNFESFDELIITSIQILRASSLDDYSRSSFLLLEGSDDSKFWTYYISDESCRIIICNGKKHIVAAIEKISKEKITGVLGIVDDDFDSLEGKTLNLPNLIATETHDLECLLLRSRAFEKVLAEHGDSQKIKKFKQGENKELREALLKRCEIFGQLRWLSCKYDWKFSFDRLPPNNFVNKDWEVDKIKLLDNTIQLLENTLTKGQLQNLIDSLPQDIDLWQVCQGHDLLYVFAIAFQKVLGRKAVGSDSIASLLRQSIEFTEFLVTELATKVKNWECDNQPYQILRAYHQTS
jgi:hypothetical protein